MAASVLKIGISRNPICDNLVGFPKSGHIFFTARANTTTRIRNVESGVMGRHKVAGKHSVITDCGQFGASLATYTVFVLYSTLNS